MMMMIGFHVYSTKLSDAHREFVLINDGFKDRPLTLKLSKNQPLSLDMSFEVNKKSEMKQFPLKSLPYYGILGVVNLSNDVFLLLVSDRNVTGELYPSKTAYQITGVDAYSLTNEKNDFIYTQYLSSVNSLGGGAWNSVLNYDEEERLKLESHCCFEICRYLSNGSFYFSPSYNLTLSTQNMFQKPSPFVCLEEKDIKTNESAGNDDQEGFDSIIADKKSLLFNDYKFFWNKFLLDAIISFIKALAFEMRTKFFECGFIVSIISGFIYVSNNNALATVESPKVVLISRVCCDRAGTRFLSRGIDDDGNVANFVETEIVLSYANYIFSMTQIRGSVPIFWDQQGFQIGQHKFQFTRSFEACGPAFETHFNGLTDQYGQVHAVNLLSSKESNTESLLTKSYEQHISKYLQTALMPIYYTSFDFNSICKDEYHRVSELLALIKENINEFGYFLYDKEKGEIVFTQSGVFRVNCLDCLDRTNVVQSSISKVVCEQFLANFCHFGKKAPTYTLTNSAFIYSFNTAWADNGDTLSLLYTGTGALKSGFTRTGKRTLGGYVNDFFKSTQRFYMNNFQDKFRQKTIDLILGKTLYQGSVALASTSQLYEENLSPVSKLSMESNLLDCSIYAITWNLKAAAPSTVDPLPLFQPLWKLTESQGIPDLIVFGFQEIIELSPQQFLSTDLNRKHEWQSHLLAKLNEYFNFYSETPYVLLSCTQLVGILLVIFIASDKVKYVKKLECFSRKTGFGGVTGNKGTVGIRFTWGLTPICILNSHFASGQDSTQIRNKEYISTFSESRYPSGYQISDHKTILWLGDFNYRIDLPVAIVKSCLESFDYESLLKYDQLLTERRNSEVFNQFLEGRITFLPTYKFIEGTDQYELTQRVPGWTDRIFYKNLEQLYYTSIADLNISDHQAVVAYFQLKPSPLLNNSNTSSLLNLSTDVITKPSTTESLLIDFEELKLSNSDVKDFPKSKSSSEFETSQANTLNSSWDWIWDS